MRVLLSEEWRAYAAWPLPARGELRSGVRGRRRSGEQRSHRALREDPKRVAVTRQRFRNVTTVLSGRGAHTSGTTDEEHQQRL